MKLEAALLFSLLMTSCGSSDGSHGGSSVDLTGTYISECITETKVIRAFSGNELTWTMSTYKDSKCVDLSMVWESKYTFTIGDQLSNLANTYKIDYTQTSSTLEIKDQSVLDDANSKKEFGYSDWALNTKKDIAGMSASSGDKEDANGTKSYWIFKLDGGKLFSGDLATGDGTTPEKRPTSINTATYGVKQ
jgi:hypothetical protein